MLFQNENEGWCSTVSVLIHVLFSVGHRKDGERSEREKPASLQTQQQRWATKTIVHVGRHQHHFCSIKETLLFLSQASSLKSRRPSTRRSMNWDAPAEARSPSLTCLISSIFAGRVWRASWMMKWPNAFQQRSWSPGTCWPAATTTHSTSAPDSRCSGGWECSFAMGFYFHSGEMNGYSWLNVGRLVFF